ncbi:hypothetical protein [Neobacillus massiliamazoniensis]|nr:hypothetical protein [Neobacillus massiliamazoniensis]
MLNNGGLVDGRFGSWLGSHSDYVHWNVVFKVLYAEIGICKVPISGKKIY